MADQLYSSLHQAYQSQQYQDVLLLFQDFESQIHVWKDKYTQLNDAYSLTQTENIKLQKKIDKMKLQKTNQQYEEVLKSITQQKDKMIVQLNQEKIELQQENSALKRQLDQHLNQINYLNRVQDENQLNKLSIQDIRTQNIQMQELMLQQNKVIICQQLQKLEKEEEKYSKLDLLFKQKIQMMLDKQQQEQYQWENTQIATQKYIKQLQTKIETLLQMQKSHVQHIDQQAIPVDQMNQQSEISQINSEFLVLFKRFTESVNNDIDSQKLNLLKQMSQIKWGLQDVINQQSLLVNEKHST